MDGNRQRSSKLVAPWTVAAPTSGPPTGSPPIIYPPISGSPASGPPTEPTNGLSGRQPLVLLLVGVLVVGLFVGGGSLLGNYLGRHSGKPPATPVAPAAPGKTAQQPSPPAPPSQPPSSQPAQPDTVTYEAEDPANTLSGGAFVASYAGASGGRIVKNIGAWGSPAGTGRLAFTNVRVAAAGQYAMKLFYVHVNGDATRTLLVSVDGAGPIRVSVSGGSACCRSQAVTVGLKAGVNRITLSNPAGHAPAIDRITVARV
jgi:hypothetical protein